MMAVRTARSLAEDLGYRLEKVRGQDRWIVRDLHSGISLVSAAYGMTFGETVRWLERRSRARSRPDIEPRDPPPRAE